MADDFSQSECEDASSQWDLVSMSGFSESDSGGVNVVGEQEIAEVEMHFDHFNCPLSPTLSPQALAMSLDNLSSGQSPVWEEGEEKDSDKVQADSFSGASRAKAAAHLVEEDEKEAMHEVLAVDGRSISSVSNLSESCLSLSGIKASSKDTKDSIAHPSLHSNSTTDGSSFQPSTSAESSTSVVNTIPTTLVGSPLEGQQLDHKDPQEQANPCIFLQFEKKHTPTLQNVKDCDDSAEKCELELFRHNDQNKGLGVECECECEEAWWMRQALSWKNQARQANCLWSIALAAALMGLAILGQRWQHERYQNQHLRLQLSVKEKKVNQLLLQVSRLKRTISSRRRVQVHRGKTCYHGLKDCF